MSIPALSALTGVPVAPRTSPAPASGGGSGPCGASDRVTISGEARALATGLAPEPPPGGPANPVPGEGEPTDLEGALRARATAPAPADRPARGVAAYGPAPAASDPVRIDLFG
jgi:hypothetical protein